MESPDDRNSDALDPCSDETDWRFSEETPDDSGQEAQEFEGQENRVRKKVVTTSGNDEWKKQQGLRDKQDDRQEILEQPTTAEEGLRMLAEAQKIWDGMMIVGEDMSGSSGSGFSFAPPHTVEEAESDEIEEGPEHEEQ